MKVPPLSSNGAAPPPPLSEACPNQSKSFQAFLSYWSAWLFGRIRRDAPAGKPPGSRPAASGLRTAAAVAALDGAAPLSLLRLEMKGGALSNGF